MNAKQARGLWHRLCRYHGFPSHEQCDFEGKLIAGKCHILKAQRPCRAWREGKPTSAAVKICSGERLSPIADFIRNQNVNHNSDGSVECMYWTRHAHEVIKETQKKSQSTMAAAFFADEIRSRRGRGPW